jgi:hypothetical protein
MGSNAEFPPAIDFVVALGPAAGLAGLTLLPRLRIRQSAARAHLSAWGLFAAAILVTRPTTYTLQFLVGVGIPLLGLGALALGRAGTRAIWLAAALSCSTFVVAMSIVTRPEPRWFVPAERLGIARALRAVCEPGDMLLAPADVGLYAAALTSCHSYVSHAAVPGFAERLAALEGFYSPRTTAGDRAAFLSEQCVAHVVLPATLEDCPEALLGPGTAFCRTASAWSRRQALSVYSRRPATGCARPHS